MNFILSFLELMSTYTILQSIAPSHIPARTRNKNQNESEFLSYFSAILSFLVIEEMKDHLIWNLFKGIFLLQFILKQLKRALTFSIFKI